MIEDRFWFVVYGFYYGWMYSSVPFSRLLCCKSLIFCTWSLGNFNVSELLCLLVLQIIFSFPVHCKKQTWSQREHHGRKDTFFTENISWHLRLLGCISPDGINACLHI